MIGVSWLHKGSSRCEKAANSLVVCTKRAVLIAVEMYVRMWGRKHTVLEYE